MPDDPRFPVYPQRLVADVRKVMPDDGIIALDNGVYKIWFARNYRAQAPNTVHVGQRVGDHGGRLAFGDGGATGVSAAQSDGDLR